MPALLLFIIAIAAGAILRLPPGLAIGLGAAGFLAIFSGIFFREKSPGTRRAAWLFFTGAAVLGLARGGSLPGPDAGPGTVAFWNDFLAPVELRGEIIGAPEPAGRGVRYPIAATEIRAGRLESVGFSLDKDFAQEIGETAGEKISPAGAIFGETAGIFLAPAAEPDKSFYSSVPAAGRVLVTGPIAPRFEIGDRIVARGSLATPFETDEFSYRDFLARRGIYSTMNFAGVQKVGESDNFFTQVWRQILSVKQNFERHLGRAYPEPESSLAAGILLGSRAEFPPDFEENLRKTGLVHLVAVSGYNTTIVAAVILFLAKPLGRRRAVAVALAGIAFFVLFTGGSAAAVRAGVMGALGLFALGLGREAIAGRLLILATAGLAAWDPRFLTADLGFQLSVLATAGIIWIVPIFEKIWAKITRPAKSGTLFALRKILFATLAAEAAVGPLLAFNFGTVSVVAPLANILAEPAIPLAMLASAIAGGAGFLSENLGAALGILTTPLLSWVTGVADFLAKIPAAEVPAAVGRGFVFLWYAGFFAVCVGSARRLSQEKFSG